MWWCTSFRDGGNPRSRHTNFNRGVSRGGRLGSLFSFHPDPTSSPHLLRKPQTCKVLLHYTIKECFEIYMNHVLYLTRGECLQTYSSTTIFPARSSSSLPVLPRSQFFQLSFEVNWNMKTWSLCMNLNSRSRVFKLTSQGKFLKSPALTFIGDFFLGHPLYVLVLEVNILVIIIIKTSQIQHLKSCITHSSCFLDLNVSWKP